MSNYLFDGFPNVLLPRENGILQYFSHSDVQEGFNPKRHYQKQTPVNIPIPVLWQRLGAHGDRGITRSRGLADYK